MSTLGLLHKLFTKRDKQFLGLLLLLSIAVSIVETVGVSALMLFVSAATNFDFIKQSKFFSYWYNFCGFTHPSNFVITLGIALIVFYGFRALVNIVHIYYLNMFAQMRQHNFATTLFRRYLHLEFKDFALQSSSTLSQVLFSYATNTTQVITGILNIAAESFTLFAIYAMLFYVNWKMTLVLTGLLTLKVLILIKTFSGRITQAGKHSQQLSHKMGSLFNQTFGNYKFLKLLSDEQEITNKFRSINYDYARANNVNAVWQGMPRFILETLGFFILIGVIVYVLFRYNNAQFVIPVVSMYALAFYRFLPSINKILMSYNQVIFNRHALEPLYKYLHIGTEHLGNHAIAFKKSINLETVSFAYEANKPIIVSATLNIKKGEKIGFVGESGAGKTTLVDIIIGLLKPTNGHLIVDDLAITPDTLRAWRHHIGYIPQQVYLFDGTAAENVVCGRTRNEQHLVAVLKQANMYDFLQAKGGLDIKVGEAGIQLSGGQKQRLAIARALYGNPSILVLDEATSSLDNENEERIMNEIYDSAEEKTLLIIAHRLTTIARCNRVYKIENGIVAPSVTPVKVHATAALLS